MIGKLTGHLETLDATTHIVDVQGVGYLVSTPVGIDLKPNANGEVTLYIHTSVREDAIELFGFASYAQQTLFNRVIKVSGIGPKLGLAVLGRFTIPEFIQAIESENLALLTTISGVGKKTAQRLALELRGKLHDLSVTSGLDRDLPPIPTSSLLEDLRSALTNLGYNDRQVTQTLQQLAPGAEERTLDQLLRESLSLLSSH